MFSINSPSSTKDISTTPESCVSHRGNIGGGDYKYMLAQDTHEDATPTVGITSTANGNSVNYNRPHSISCKFYIKY